MNQLHFLLDGLGSFSGLLNNASLMLLLSVVYDTFGIYAIARERLRDLITGTLVGLISVAVMSNPWSLQPGVFFDTRWVLLSLSGLFFGFRPTVIAVCIAGLFRYCQGGPGRIVGTIVIIVTAGVGVLWRYWREKQPTNDPIGWRELYIFGLIVQLAMLSCIFLMPKEMVWPILKSVAPPILLIFPVLTVVVGLILKRQDLRRKAERELVENRKVLIKERGLLRGVINSIADLIFFKDTRGAYLGCNKAFESFVGADEGHLLGKSDIDADKTGLFKHLDNEVIVTEKPIRMEGWADDTEGRRRLLETVKTPFKGLDGTLHGLVGISRDVTDRKQAEQEREKLQDQLIHAQKMESVGRLAGGVAHDFNNMLGVILGHTELVMEELPSDHPLYDSLNEIRTAARRSANLTKQLLAFARRQTIDPQVLDLNETVRGMLSMLKQVIGEQINLVWHPGEKLSPVKVDPSQIDQILANLCINARDAIADTGTITIKTGEDSFDQAYCLKHDGVAPGCYVMLAVSDDGCGMGEDVLSQLFEPFYTTKEMHKGTGLGLATVYGIVKQNGGLIVVESKPEEGSTFKIFLPRHEGGSDRPVRENVSGDSVTHGYETILLTEDEPMILAMTAMMLKSRGYNVLSAASPSEAMRIAEEFTETIHLLATDVVMPDMNGRDLAARLCVLHPEMRVLFMSGYTANVIAHHGVLETDVNFLQKPFTLEDIATKIREVLAFPKGG